ncbi:MAG: DDE-type integrase/transposase/recombinase [Bacteriovoracia bacterium]
MAYRKFDISVKRKIAETKNLNLFPELKIPRTTAQYWISQSKEIAEASNQSDKKNDFMQEEAKLSLKLEVEVYKTLLVKIMGTYDFSSLKGAQNKKFIVELVSRLKGSMPKSALIRMLGMSSSKFYRWETEVLGCRFQRENCQPSLPHQVSLVEQNKMLELARNNKLAHLSVKSLMYYAQREGGIYRGYDTWLKYLKLNGVMRVRNHKRKKKYAEGIRARRANQIWHIDITIVRIKTRERYYIQMAVDNFSRLIVGWKISDRKSLDITLKTLKEVNFHNPKFLLCDAGTENRASEVSRFLLGRGIIQLIANIDVRYSNSIVEAVFRQLKYAIDFQKIRSLKNLKNKIAWFVEQHNHNVPHSSLYGATPFEVYFDIFNKEVFKEEINEKRKMLLESRKNSYLQCKSCIPYI